MSSNSVDKTRENLNEFKNFINYIITNPDLSKYRPYESITNISKSNSNDETSRALIESEFKMINFDNVCTFTYTKNNGKSGSEPLSVDALYLDEKKSILYLIEFKNDTLEDYKKELYDFIKDNKDISDNGILNKIYKTYVDERYYKLKYKPLESVLLVLPKTYEKYLKSSEKKNIGDLYSFLINDIKIHLLIVCKTPYLNTLHVLNKGSINRKFQKINQFKPIINKWEIMDEKDFKNFIDKFEKNYS